tara:strand:- start:2822 stop:4951 length:2130 start_codon:yes stop_codon:yes gene_type:complete
MGKVLIFLSLGFFSTILYSQTNSEQVIDTIQIKEVEVTILRSRSKLQNLPVNVSILSKIEIEESQATTPADALKYIPGIAIQSDGGLANTPVIRGLSRERAPILIDGNSFVGGRIRTYTLIDPFQIERIEVIKGPASAFWGSDAVGGLINIITRKGKSGYNKDFKLGLSSYSGYQSVNNHRRERLEVEGRGNGFDFLIGAGIRNADNTNTPAGEIPNSQFKSEYLDWNIGYSPKQNHRIEISGKYFKNDDMGFPGGLGAPGPPKRIRLFSPDEQKAINFGYRADQVSERIESIGLNVYSKTQRLHIDMITNVYFKETTNINKIIHPNLDVDVNFGGARGFVSLKQKGNSKLTFGLDYLKEHRIGTYRNLVINIFNPKGVQVNQVSPPAGKIQPDSYSNSIGMFAVEELTLSTKTTVLLALRFDNIKTKIEDNPFFIAEIANLYNSNNTSSKNNSLTGNIGLKYLLTDRSNITLNVANSFRGPDLFSKYNFADGVLPNPDLKSEKGIFYEIGYGSQKERLSFNVNYYQNSLSNLFVPVNVDFQGTPAIQNQNVGKAKIKGLEYSFIYRIGDFSSVFWTGSYIRGKDENMDKYLSFMPADQNLIGLRIRDNTNRYFGALEGVIMSKQDRIALTERETDSYSLLNLKAGLNLNNMINNFPVSKLVFSIDNVFDKKYQHHLFRGLPGNITKFYAPGKSINLLFIIRLGIAGNH